MIGFIIGLFLGAVIGTIIIGVLMSDRAYDDDLEVVEEEKVCDITPELAQMARQVMEDYVQVTECRDCAFERICTGHNETICDVIK